jgi:hypothetical protein
MALLDRIGERNLFFFIEESLTFRRYLIPTLGIAPYAAVGLFSLYTYEDDQIYIPTSQAVGIQFFGLTDQTLFDFYNSMFGCGYVSYTVTPPSIAGAPADQVSGLALWISLNNSFFSLRFSLEMPRTRSLTCRRSSSMRQHLSLRLLRLA